MTKRLFSLISLLIPFAACLPQPEVARVHFVALCAQNPGWEACDPLQVVSVQSNLDVLSKEFIFTAFLSRPFQSLSIDNSSDPLQQDSVFDQIVDIRIRQNDTVLHISPSQVLVRGPVSFGSNQSNQITFTSPLSGILLKKSFQVEIDLLDWQGNFRSNLFSMKLPLPPPAV